MEIDVKGYKLECRAKLLGRQIYFNASEIWGCCVCDLTFFLMALLGGEQKTLCHAHLYKGTLKLKTTDRKCPCVRHQSAKWSIKFYLKVEINAYGKEKKCYKNLLLKKDNSQIKVGIRQKDMKTSGTFKLTAQKAIFQTKQALGILILEQSGIGS